MNWFIREKIFTYFYNKFRPVNRVHYIKYDVNSSSLTYFWLLQKVCGTLDHCFSMTHIIHNEGDTLQIYFCVIFCKTRNHAQPHVTSGTHINCTLSLAVRRAHTAEVCWRFHWPLFVMVTHESQNISCSRTWSSNQSGGGAILALSSFLNQIPHQKEPEISVGIFSPTWR